MAFSLMARWMWPFRPITPRRVSIVGAHLRGRDKLILRKQWGPSSITIGYSGQRGGAQEVNGVETGVKTHRDQIRLYGTHWLNQTTQLQGMYAKDIDVEGGFEYDSVVQLRIVKVF